MERPEFCSRCPISNKTRGYVPLKKGYGSVLFVGEAAGSNEADSGLPFVGGAGQWLNSLLRSCKLNRNELNIINTIGCCPPNNAYPGSEEWTRMGFSYKEGRDAIQHCRENHLKPILDGKWNRIVALGEQALRSLTGKYGITKWRGSPLQLKDKPEAGYLVMPTYHPAYLMRNQMWFPIAKHDLTKSLVTYPEDFNLNPSITELQNFQSKNIAFDLEWDSDGNITICGIADKEYKAIVCTFEEPYISELKRIFESATDLIGHNIISADLPYFKKLGWNIQANLHDTMLKQHLIQPEYPHSLAFTSSVWTRRVFWKGRGEGEEDEYTGEVIGGEEWKTWNDPIRGIPIEYGGYLGCKSAEEAYKLYNARDTAASFEVNLPLDYKLKTESLEKLYWNVSVPAAQICLDMSQAGWRIDPTKVKKVRDSISTEIEALEKELPEGLAPYEEPCMVHVPAGPNDYSTKKKKCKKGHDEVIIEFTAPGILNCPTCNREIESGKMKLLKVKKEASTKPVLPWRSSKQVLEYAKTRGLKPAKNKKVKGESADKSSRKVWARTHPEFATLDKLSELDTIRNTFAKEVLQTIDRMYFNLKVHGTKEGRLSSTGRRKGIDGNIQNQPKQIRYIYLPDYDGWGLLEADWKSGENMLTSYLAQDWDRLNRQKDPNYDEHSALAQEIFQKEVSRRVNSHLRHIAKSINHGLNYLMGDVHMQEELAKEGHYFTRKEIADFKQIWRLQNPKTAAWQAEVVRIAGEQGYLANPFGRKLWFYTSDYGPKAAAFLPASTLADMCLRSMIALHADKYIKNIEALGLLEYGNLPEAWRLVCQVHDSLVSTGPHEMNKEAALLIKRVMTQEFPELPGFHLDVSLGYSTESWGDCKEIEY